MVSRSQWRARAPKYRNTADMDRRSTGHWNGPTVTVGGKTEWDHKYCASLVRGTQDFHMDSRGWSDIAYNFVICPHNYVFEGRGLNVINGANGTNEGNRTSHAIMVMAGTDNPHTDGEKRAFRYCYEYIRSQVGTPEGCIGHRDHKSTECPGDIRYRWIHAGMPVSGTSEPKKEKEMAEDIYWLHVIYLGASTNPANWTKALRDSYNYHLWRLTSGDKTLEQVRVDFQTTARSAGAIS